MQNGASEVKVGTIKAGDLTPRRARPPVCRHAVAELRKLQQKKKLQGRLGWGPATWRDVWISASERRRWDRNFGPAVRPGAGPGSPCAQSFGALIASEGCIPRSH